MQIVSITIVATKAGWNTKAIKVAPGQGKATCQELRREGWTISSTFATFAK
jgi:hypothetical protein